MEQNPLYFDGSIQIDYATNKESAITNSYEITDEIRSKMSGNPYMF